MARKPHLAAMSDARLDEYWTQIRVEQAAVLAERELRRAEQLELEARDDGVFMERLWCDDTPAA